MPAALGSPTINDGMLDLEDGSHHVMVNGGYLCSDEVSHLSDPTDLESTPRRQHKSPHRLSFLGRIKEAETPPKKRNRRILIRRPWKCLKKVVRRQTTPEKPSTDPMKDKLPEHDQELKYDTAIQSKLDDRPQARQAPVPQLFDKYQAAPQKATTYHNLLPPTEQPYHESDPLLFFENSSNCDFPPQSPGAMDQLGESKRYHTMAHRLSAATTAQESTSRATNSQNRLEAVFSTWHIAVTIFMYTLLLTVCCINLLAPSWSISAISLLLGIGSATICLYLVQLKLVCYATEPILRVIGS